MTTTNTIPQVNATVKLNADVNLISLAPFAGKNLKVIKHENGTISAPIFLLVEDEEGSTIFVAPDYVTEVSDVDQVEGETVAELEFKLASIKGNDPAAEGRRAAIKEEIARAMFRTEPTTTNEDTTMTTYAIYSKQGADFGLWTAATEAAALYDMHEDAGYGHVVSYDEANDKLLFLDDETKDFLGDVEDWIFEEYEVH